VTHSQCKLMRDQTRQEHCRRKLEKALLLASRDPATGHARVSTFPSAASDMRAPSSPSSFAGVTARIAEWACILLPAGLRYNRDWRLTATQAARYWWPVRDDAAFACADAVGSALRGGALGADDEHETRAPHARTDARDARFIRQLHGGSRGWRRVQEQVGLVDTSDFGSEPHYATAVFMADYARGGALRVSGWLGACGGCAAWCAVLGRW
jgi:hypothetical protein